MKEKVYNFVKKNWILISILVLAFVLRLKYFNINSAVWWDEGDYLSLARKWAFHLDNIPSIWVAHRTFLMPLIWAGLYKIADSELLLRVSQLVFSMAAVFFTYLLGKEMFNKKVGLISSFLLSVFWLHLFLTARLLLDLPSATLLLITFYFLWKGYKNKKYTWLAGFFMGLAIFARMANMLIFVPFLIIFNIVKKSESWKGLVKLKFLKALKEKKFWMFVIFLLLALSPYILWVLNRADWNPIEAVRISLNLKRFAAVTTPTALAEKMNTNLVMMYLSAGLKYVTYYPTMLNLILLSIFIFGLILFFDFVLGMDLIFKNTLLQKKIFVLFWIIIPTIGYGIQSAETPNILEARYLIVCAPAIFYVISYGLLKIYNYAKGKIKYGKWVALSLVLVILFAGGYLQLDYAKADINSRKDSYLQVKEAALWIKENSKANDLIISNSIPQTIYYSDRAVEMMSENNEQEILAKNPKFLVTSIYERSPQWFYEYPEKHNLKPVRIYSLDGKNPSLIIYQMRS